MSPGRFRPTPALVISVIALFVALGGVGYAAATIGTSDIKDGAVTNRKLADDSVSVAKLKDGAVRSEKIGSGQVQASNLAGGSVKSGKIAGQAVTTGKLGSDSVTAPKLAGTTEASNTNASIATGALATVTATCPSGDQAISGGYTTPDSGEVRVISMHRASDSSWSVRFLNSGVGANPATASVTCLTG